MALQFPTNPTVGQVYQLWTWDGQKWICTGGGGNGGNGGGGDVIGNGVIGMPSKTIVFNSSGTYTPTAGITSAMVECFGGGGAGGWANNTVTDFGPGGGGGSGGYSRSVLLPSQIGVSQAVTIGQGGTSTTSSSSAGTATSFGSLVVANGGQAGGITTTPDHTDSKGGDGATRGTGDFTLPGMPGGNGIMAPDPSAPTYMAVGGFGGSLWGGGGKAIRTAGTSLSVAGLPAAANTGGGGGGATSVASQGSPPALQPGGAGGSGVCIVTEYSMP